MNVETTGKCINVIKKLNLEKKYITPVNPFLLHKWRNKREI